MHFHLPIWTPKSDYLVFTYLFMGFQQDEPYMKPGLADQKNAIVVPHIASASKVKGAPEKYELMDFHSC